MFSQAAGPVVIPARPRSPHAAWSACVAGSISGDSLPSHLYSTGRSVLCHVFVCVCYTYIYMSVCPVSLAPQWGTAD